MSQDGALQLRRENSRDYMKEYGGTTSRYSNHHSSNRQLVRNYISVLVAICFTNVSQADESKQECLLSCLNLLKQIKQLKHLNKLGYLEGRPDIIAEESKYILGKLDEFYKEIHNGQEPSDPSEDIVIDFYEADDEVVTNKPILKNKDINANLLQEVQSITLKTKELIQRMNEIKFPKNHLIITARSELED